MERALVNTPATVDISFTEDGVPTDPSPDSALVTIVRGDGTVLVNAQAATDPDPSGDDAPGEFYYTIPANVNTVLDRLTATFSSSLGQAPILVDVAGGYLISGAKLLELYPELTPQEREERRIDIEDRLEQACGVAFVPRYEREYITVNRRGKARLKWGWIRSIRSVTVRGVLMDPSLHQYLDVDLDGGIVRGLTPSQRHDDVLIEYEHGATAGSVPTAQSAALDALTETYGPDRVDGRIVQKQVDNVSVTYDRKQAAAANIEFTTRSVVSFILNNRRPLVA